MKESDMNDNNKINKWLVSDATIFTSFANSWVNLSLGLPNKFVKIPFCLVWNHRNLFFEILSKLYYYKYR